MPSSATMDDSSKLRANNGHSTMSNCEWPILVLDGIVFYQRDAIEWFLPEVARNLNDMSTRAHATRQRFQIINKFFGRLPSLHNCCDFSFLTRTTKKHHVQFRCVEHITEIPRARIPQIIKLWSVVRGKRLPEYIVKNVDSENWVSFEWPTRKCNNELHAI